MDKEENLKKEDSSVEEIPKHLKGYKDPDKRKEWMRNYHRNYYHKKLKNKGFSRDEMVKKNNAEKEVLNTELNKTNMGQAITMIKDVIGDKDDPVVKAIDKYGKYVPLVTGFLQGFLQRAQEHQGSQQKSQSRENTVEAPNGWNSLSPIQKLQRKYMPNGEESAWYRAGIAYDKDSQEHNVEYAGVSHNPVAMKETIHGHNTAYRNMNDLAAASRNDVGENLASPAPEIIEAKVEAKVERETISRNDEKPTHEADLPSDHISKTVKDGIVNQVVGETMNYMNLIVGYFKNRPIEQFKQDVDNAEQTVDKFFKGVGAFLPYQAKDIILTTTFKQLKDLVERESPEKIKYLEDENKLDQFEKLWKGIQEKIKG